MHFHSQKCFFLSLNEVDLSCAIIALLLLSPLLLIIALAVKISDPKTYYLSKLAWVKMESFTVYKFRAYTDAEEQRLSRIQRIWHYLK